MNEFQATTVIVALFALRCIVPIALMFAIGYGMKRLVRHWENEEAARPRESIPLVVVAGTSTPPASAKVPCWVLNNCDEQTRLTCPAYASPLLACWMARLRAEGQMPAKCAGCSLYAGSPSFAAGD